MKKLILISLVTISLNAYGEKLDIDEYMHKFSYFKDGFSSCFVNPAKAVKLINKIEFTNKKSKKEVLLVLLDIELDRLEDLIHSEEYQQFLKEHEYMIDKNREIIETISEWRDKYLNQSSSLIDP